MLHRQYLSQRIGSDIWTACTDFGADRRRNHRLYWVIV